MRLNMIDKLHRRRWHIIVTVLGFIILLFFKLLTTQTDSLIVRIFPADPEIVYLRDVWKSGHARIHPELCPKLGKQLRFFFFVMSAPGHTAHRDAIRFTWGQRLPNISLAFILGQFQEEFKAAIDLEDHFHGDIIIGRNLDTYFNLSLKTLSMLEWVNTYCPRVPFILKVDDDVFINVPRLLEFFSGARMNATHTIWGSTFHKALPDRNISSKYYVSNEQFPGTMYPDFETGPAYVFTADCVQPLLKAAVPLTRYLPLEDVLVTGVLGQRAGLRRRWFKTCNNDCVEKPCTMRRYIAMHKIYYYDQFDLWIKFNDNKTICRNHSKNII